MKQLLVQLKLEMDKVGLHDSSLVLNAFELKAQLSGKIH